jgi:hypothetical protein
MWIDEIKNLYILKIFARAKPGATSESVEEEEALEEEHAEDRQKQLYDEYPHDDGWKVSGTIKNNQGYKRPPFVQEIIQVKLKFYLSICYFFF